MSAEFTTVFITGAAQGIGLAVAESLLGRPNTVCFVGSRSLSKAQLAIESLKDGNKIHETSRAVAVQIDITNDASIGSAVKHVQEVIGTDGPLDILINNAALSNDVGDDLSLRQQMAKVYDTNVFGTAVTTEAFVPLLQRSGRARVINVSSGLGSNVRMRTIRQQLMTAYNTSKSALNSITTVFSIKYPGIRFVAVSPGFIATALTGFHKAGKTPGDGAKIIVQMAFDEGQDSGIFVDEDRTAIPW